MPKIDRLQKKQIDDQREESLYDGMVVVFGEELCLRWALPIPGGALINRRDGLMDYRRAAATATTHEHQA